MGSMGISTYKIVQPICPTTWHTIPKIDNACYSLLQDIGGEKIVSIKRAFIGLGRITAIGLRKPAQGRNCSECSLNCPLSRRERA